ncbi:MAG: PEP-CTERM sorting domain-containing protein [Myxococcota bacterium]
MGRGRSRSGSEAFVWDAVHGLQGLGDLPGGNFLSIAADVSADGSTVVGLATSEAGLEAFVWDANTGMTSLQVLLTSLGVDLAGWQLSEARGVSADGKAIVGYGTNPSGFTEAFIAVIPEPSSAILISLGLMGLAMRRPSI